jgi:hypothetical protein
LRWRDGYGAFLCWAVVGFTVVFGFLALLSIGAPFILLGLVLMATLLNRGSAWPAAVGFIGGVGIVGVVIGIIGVVDSPAIWGAVGVGLAALSGASFWRLHSRPTFR